MQIHVFLPSWDKLQLPRVENFIFFLFLYFLFLFDFLAVCSGITRTLFAVEPLTQSLHLWEQRRRYFQWFAFRCYRITFANALLTSSYCCMVLSLCVHLFFSGAFPWATQYSVLNQLLAKKFSLTVCSQGI